MPLNRFLQPRQPSGQYIIPILEKIDTAATKLGGTFGREMVISCNTYGAACNTQNFEKENCVTKSSHNWWHTFSDFLYFGLPVNVFYCCHFKEKPKKVVFACHLRLQLEKMLKRK